VPRISSAARALLVTLLSVIPKARRQRLQLLITPDTVLRWHRDIVRRRWAARTACGRTGRPATRRNIRALVRRLARENLCVPRISSMALSSRVALPAVRP
jgi:putative transposase